MSGTCECGVYVPYIKGLWAKRLCVWQQQAFKGFSTHTPTHTNTTSTSPSHARTFAHTCRQKEYIYIECTHKLRVNVEVSLATWNFTYTIIPSHFLPVDVDYPIQWLPKDAHSMVDLDPTPNPKLNINPKLKPKPEYKPHLTPLLLRTSSPSDMCSITSVLQNVFYLHRLAEFISFFMQHQRFMCLLEGMLWLC